MNQEFSISSKGEALSGKTSILHANAERMNILEALGADVVSLGNEHAAGYGQDALKENMELLKKCRNGICRSRNRCRRCCAAGVFDHQWNQDWIYISFRHGRFL